MSTPVKLNPNTCDLKENDVLLVSSPQWSGTVFPHCLLYWYLFPFLAMFSAALDTVCQLACCWHRAASKVMQVPLEGGCSSQRTQNFVVGTECIPFCHFFLKWENGSGTELSVALVVMPDHILKYQPTNMLLFDTLLLPAR